MPKNKNVQYQPTPRGFYAFNIERAGDFLIYVEAHKDCYKFLYVPGASEFYLTFQDFTTALKAGVLTFVEQLPEEIYKESLMLSCPTKTLQNSTNENYKNQKQRISKKECNA